MKIKIKITGLLIPLITLGCMPSLPQGHWSKWDLSPPVLINANTPGPKEFSLVFNEAVTLLQEPETTPPYKGRTSRPDERSIRIEGDSPMNPGEPYEVLCYVRDARGNKSRLCCTLYGHNPNTPGLLLTELRLRGSGNHPDLAEILCLTDGNLAGVTVFDGLSGDWDQQFRLPPADVKAGDFLIIHFKPKGTEDEIQETKSNTQSKGLDSEEFARDFWVTGGKGLPGNNGIVSIYDQPYGKMIDMIFYSNRTPASDESYGGFGSQKLRTRIASAEKQGQWSGAAPEPSPLDGVNPDGSTSTRTLCRFSDNRDTNTKEDWFICKTSGHSFGKENTDEPYTPK